MAEKNSRKKTKQKNNGSELYRMFAQVKLAQQKRICVCVRCVCAKIVLSKYFVFVVFVRVWTKKKKKKMPVDGTRESVLVFFPFLFVRTGEKVSSTQICCSFLFSIAKKEENDSRKIRYFALRRRVPTTWIWHDDEELTFASLYVDRGFPLGLWRAR